MLLLRPLRHRNLALLWGGMSLSALGDQVGTLALTWVAVRVFGAAAGYLTALQAGVLLLALLGVGRVADRLDHWTAMIGADLGRAAVLFAMAGAWMLGFGPDSATGGGFGLMTVIVALGFGEAMFRPALQAVLPSVAGDPRLLPAANGLLDATSRSARLVGPALVALLGAMLPIVHFFTLDAVSFVASAGALLLIGRSQAAGRGAVRPGAARHDRESAWRGILRGGRAMARHRLLGTMLAIAAPLSGIWYAIYFLGVPLLIARLALHGPDGSELGAYGLVMSAYGSTNLAATLAFGGRAMPARPQFQMFGGNILVGLGIILTGLAAFLPQGWLLPGLAIGAAAGAAGGPMKDIPVAVLRQTCIAPGDAAAAMRAYMAVNSAGMLLGMLLAPRFFQFFGVVPVILAGGAALAGIGVFGILRHADWVEPPATLDRVLASR